MTNLKNKASFFKKRKSWRSSYKASHVPKLLYISFLINCNANCNTHIWHEKVAEN